MCHEPGAIQMDGDAISPSKNPFHKDDDYLVLMQS
jgi:hypothetical protein